MNAKRPKDNLTKGEQKALEELSKRDDIIITNADKGRAIVIMDTDKVGRPVIRSINCDTSKISKYVDYHLQPTRKKIP